MAKGVAIKYTPEQLAFIEANCTLERKVLTEKVNSAFGTQFSVDQIKALCTRKGWKTGRTGHFNKGEMPWNTGTKGVMKPNEGSFKKGQVSWNHKPVGHERICSKDGYVIIKTAEPNIYEHKHRVLWAQHNGPVPDNHVVVFKNMDRTDCRIDNLVLLSRSELVRYNQSFNKLATPESNEACITLAKIKSKKHERLKEVLR